MIEAAEAHFAIDLPRLNGSSRETCTAELKQIAERARLGRPLPWDEARATELDAYLAGPEIPPAGQYLLGWFYELHAERRSTGFGPLALDSLQIGAWANLRNIHPSPWEIGVIRALDRCWLQLWAEVKSDNDREREALSKRKSQQLM